MTKKYQVQNANSAKAEKPCIEPASLFMYLLNKFASIHHALFSRYLGVGRL